MISKQKCILILFVVASVIVIFLSHCAEINPYEEYHGFLRTEDFKKMSRGNQILKCTPCHKQEYENEIKGPHSYSYKSLVEHKDYVNSDKYDCSFYTTHVNKSFEHCLGCHTPQNLYETLLYDSLNKPELLIERVLAEAHPRPLTRTGNSDRATGIDCMSCHFDGRQMVSLKHVFTADDSIPSKQSLKQITKNNLNCYLCHADIVRNFNPAIAIKNTGSALCINCHQEYDNKGKSTHYFFWQHDAEGKYNPKPSKLLDDFTFSLSSDKKSGIITWNNSLIPHKISPGPEMVLFCDVLDKDSNLLGTKTIRINKKKEFDEEMLKAMDGNYHRGIVGDDVPLDGNPVEYKFPLKNATKASIFRISFMHKSQYWFPDSLGKISLVKTYPCN